MSQLDSVKLLRPGLLLSGALFSEPLLALETIQHYWLEVDAMAPPLKVGEPDSPTYKGKGS